MSSRYEGRGKSQLWIQRSPGSVQRGEDACEACQCVTGPPRSRSVIPFPTWTFQLYYHYYFINVSTIHLQNYRTVSTCWTLLVNNMMHCQLDSQTQTSCRHRDRDSFLSLLHVRVVCVETKQTYVSIGRVHHRGWAPRRSGGISPSRKPTISFNVFSFTFFNHFWLKFACMRGCPTWN